MQTTDFCTHRSTKFGRPSLATLTLLQPLSSWRTTRGTKGLGLLMALPLAVLLTLIRNRITTTCMTRRKRTGYSSLLCHLELPGHLVPRIRLGYQYGVSRPLHLHTPDMVPGVPQDQLVLSIRLWRHCSKMPLYHPQLMRASPHFLPRDPSFPQERKTTARLGIARPSRPNSLHARTTIAKHRELDVLKPSKSVTSNSSASSNRSRRVKQCASCDKIVDDGRWIPMDGGKVLCDKCWKNMYLPKVCVLACGKPDGLI
jgi:hypothetical protein